MLGELSKIAAAASDKGILSTFQLSVFLRCVARQGAGMYDIFGVSPGEPEYTAYYAAIRQLMLGASDRGYNGANLLGWGENIRGKERAIILTPKGRRFLKEINQTLGTNATTDF